MKVIVFHSKHGDALYDASTNEALARSCASVIKDNYEDGWYTEFDDEWEDIQKLLSAKTLDDAASMQYTWNLTHNKGTRSMPLALYIVDRRADYEYEGYTYEQVLDPTW